MKVSSLPPSSCRKARLRLRLAKLRFERFPNTSVVPAPFVSSQHRLRPTQADLDTPDLKTDDLKVEDLKVDGDDILLIDA